MVRVYRGGGRGGEGKEWRESGKADRREENEREKTNGGSRVGEKREGGG